jgi:hypothetical protein
MASYAKSFLLPDVALYAAAAVLTLPLIHGLSRLRAKDLS